MKYIAVKVTYIGLNQVQRLATIEQLQTFTHIIVKLG